MGSALEYGISSLLPYFLFFKKTENCNFCGVLGFLEFVVLLGGVNSKIVGTFFRWAGLGSLEFFSKIFSPNGLRRCILHSDFGFLSLAVFFF